MVDNSPPPATNSPPPPILPAGKLPATNSPPSVAGVVNPSTADPPAGNPPASNSPPPATGVVNPSTAIIIPPAGNPPASNTLPPAEGGVNPSTTIDIPPASNPRASNSKPPAAGGNTDEIEETPNPIDGQEDGTVISGGQGQNPAGVGAQGTARTDPYIIQASRLGAGKFQKWKLSQQRREILEGFEKLDEKLMHDAVQIENTADKAILMALGITSAIMTMTTFPAMVVIRIDSDIIFALERKARSGLFFAFWRSKGKLDRLTWPIRKAVEDEDVIVRHGDLFFRDIDATATAVELRMRDLLPSDAKRMNKLHFRHSGMRRLQSIYLLFVWAFFLLGMLGVAYLCFGQYFRTAKEKISE